MSKNRMNAVHFVSVIIGIVLLAFLQFIWSCGFHPIATALLSLLIMLCGTDCISSLNYLKGLFDGQKAGIRKGYFSFYDDLTDIVLNRYDKELEEFRENKPNYDTEDLKTLFNEYGSFKFSLGRITVYSELADTILQLKEEESGDAQTQKVA